MVGVDMTLDEKKLYYQSLVHAMQSGIEYSKDDFEREHKHLRVGINASMSDHAALVYLLIEKGLFTEEEYFDKLIEFMKREVKMYEDKLSKEFGANIKLG